MASPKNLVTLGGAVGDPDFVPVWVKRPEGASILARDPQHLADLRVAGYTEDVCSDEDAPDETRRPYVGRKPHRRDHRRHQQDRRQGRVRANVRGNVTEKAAPKPAKKKARKKKAKK